MSDDNNLKLKAGDIEATYLAVLTSLIEVVIESGAVSPDDLATKILSYGAQVSRGDKSAGAARLAEHFAGLAKATKPKAK